MNTTSARLVRRTLLQLATGLSLLASSVAFAQANPFQRGPNPTDASLEAAAGSYAISNVRISSPQGFNGGLVYYPSGATQESYGLVVIMPGFLAVQGYYTWLATKTASNGFVVAVINANSIVDQPTSRATQMAAALKQVAAMSTQSGSPLFGKVDLSRQAVMGHSMGGGGTLEAASANPSLKAAVALAPWDADVKDFSAIQVPTQVVACEKDTIAPNDTHSDVFYASLSDAIPKGYFNVAQASHLCGIALESIKYRTMVGKASVAWLKRFVDRDTRYDAFLKGVSDPRYLKVTTSGF
ncbi:MAG: alpha/beta hydrolase [Pseudomonadota bacterium]